MRLAAVRHDMTQGFVLTQYFYEQLIQFEKDPASLHDTIGEMVYSMDVDQQVHRARQIEFDKEADGDVLTRSKPRKLTGLGPGRGAPCGRRCGHGQRHGPPGARHALGFLQRSGGGRQ